MTGQQQTSGETKTCPACGGTWPSDGRTCLACGANLESVPARPASEGQGPEPLDWRWLDTLGTEEGTTAGVPERESLEAKPGCLARILPGLG